MEDVRRRALISKLLVSVSTSVLSWEGAEKRESFGMKMRVRFTASGVGIGGCFKAMTCFSDSWMSLSSAPLPAVTGMMNDMGTRRRGYSSSYMSE